MFSNETEREWIQMGGEDLREGKATPPQKAQSFLQLQSPFLPTISHCVNFKLSTPIIKDIFYCLLSKSLAFFF